MDEEDRPNGPDPDKPGRSRKELEEILDLDRTKLTADLVTRIEEAMCAADAAREDLKAVVAEARKAKFMPPEIKAMKTLARLRKDDKGGRAREELAALRRIGRAVQFDLFDAGTGGGGAR